MRFVSEPWVRQTREKSHDWNPPTVATRSEIELQGKLDDASAVRSVKDLAEVLIANGAIRNPKDWRVQGVEELRPELQSLRLGHRKFPEEREIEVPRPVGPQGVSPQRAKRERSGVHKRRRIEPLIGA